MKKLFGVFVILCVCMLLAVPAQARLVAQVDDDAVQKADVTQKAAPVQKKAVPKVAQKAPVQKKAVQKKPTQKKTVQKPTQKPTQKCTGSCKRPFLKIFRRK